LLGYGSLGLTLQSSLHKALAQIYRIRFHKTSLHDYDIRNCYNNQRKAQDVAAPRAFLNPFLLQGARK
jgi:hypothetical protein